MINVTIATGGSTGNIGSVTLSKKGSYLLWFAGWAPKETSYYVLSNAMTHCTTKMFPISACCTFYNQSLNNTIYLSMTNWSDSQYSGKPQLNIYAVLLNES